MPLPQIYAMDGTGGTTYYTTEATDCAHSSVSYHATKTATCTEDGNIAYYTCATCGKYFSDKASNPNGGVFYQYTGEASEHMSEYRTLFKKLNLTEQDWRKSFESLGYTGQKETLQIVYFDISIGDTQITLDFHKSDSYTSDAWKALGKDFTYTFCPSLSLQEFMIVNQD